MFLLAFLCGKDVRSELKLYKSQAGFRLRIAVFLWLSALAWAKAEIAPPNVTSVAIDPNSPAVFWVAIADLGILRTSDAGATWTQVSAGPPPGISQLLALGSPTVLYALTPLPLQVFRSRDGGRTWQYASFGVEGVARIAGSPANGSILYSYDSRALFGSVDAGEHWAVIFFHGTSIQSVAVDPNDSQRIYVGASDGLFSSVDGGGTWISLNLPPALPGFPSVVGATAAAPDGMTLYATSLFCRPISRIQNSCNANIYRSDDRGSSFTQVDSGFRNSNLNTLPRDVLVVDSGSTVYDGRRVSRDAGATWESTGFAFREVIPSFSSSLVLGISGVGPDSHVDPLFSSTDQGRSWTRIALPGCSTSFGRLCLGGRFGVTAQFQLSTGPLFGHARNSTPDTGTFWVLSDNNIELAVKVVDGRPFNGQFWVFCGALTDLEYDLEITDTLTGNVWRHHNPAGLLSSFADTAAFQ